MNQVVRSSPSAMTANSEISPAAVHCATLRHALALTAGECSMPSTLRFIRQIPGSCLASSTALRARARRNCDRRSFKFYTSKSMCIELRHACNSYSPRFSLIELFSEEGAVLISAIHRCPKNISCDCSGGLNDQLANNSEGSAFRGLVTLGGER